MKALKFDEIVNLKAFPLLRNNKNTDVDFLLQNLLNQAHQINSLRGLVNKQKRKISRMQKMLQDGTHTRLKAKIKYAKRLKSKLKA